MKNESKPTKIVVFDLELNQPSEAIIELGYVIGDIFTGEIQLRKSIFVNPKETIAQEIIKLTGINQEMADSGTDLRSAYLELAKDVTKHNALTVLHQWGVSDTYLLRNQLNDPIIWKFGRRWIDIKAIAQTHAMINNTKFVGGLRKFCGRMGLQMSRANAHRADYDAEMTFKLYIKLASFFKKST